MLKMMHTAIALTMAGFGAAASAQEATSDRWMGEFRSQLTRAEVHATVMQPYTASAFEQLVAEAMGFMPILRSGTVVVRLIDGTTGEVIEEVHTAGASRSDVQAELQGAKSSGEFARLNAEAWDFQAQPASPSATRIARR